MIKLKNMKKLRFAIFTVLLALLFNFQSFSQTATATVNYTGFMACGGCVVCGADYWCINTNPSYCGATANCLTKTFFDPVPAGKIITNVTVNYYSAGCAGSFISGSINGDTVPTVNDANTGCFCDAVPCVVAATSSNNYTCNMPGYIYGGLNSLQLCTGTSVCINRVELVFTYVNPITANISGGTSPICSNTSPGTFTAIGGGGTGLYTYQWYNTISGIISGATNSTYNPGNITYTTGYYCAISDTLCVTVNTPTTTITVNSAPPATFTAQSPICANDPASIVYTGTDSATFAWNFNGATILTGTPGTSGPFTITWNSAGSYVITLQATYDSGCVSNIETHYIQVVNAGTPNCCISPTPDAGADLQFCGLTGNLQAATPDEPSYGGTWTQITGPGSSSFGDNHLTNSTVTVTLHGTYTFQWSEVSGLCDSADFVSVTFIQNPIAYGGPDTTICGILNYNMSAVLSTSGTGTWIGTGIATPSNPNSAVTVATYDLYTYIWNENNAGCVDADTVNIYFFQAPNISAGINQTVCAGSPVTLSGSGAISYIWDNGVTNGISFTTLSTTTYTVTGTDANGCSNSDSVVVSVNALPNINAGVDTTVCSGTLVTLSGSGATSYVWNNGVTNGIPFTSLATTTYTVTGTDGNGCTNTDAVLITVNQSPLTPVISQNGSTLMCSVSGMSSYQWSVNGNTVSSCNSQFCYCPQDGFYYVTITDAIGCSAISNAFSAINCIVGINETNQLTEINIYPNPNTGSFTLSFTALQGNEAEIKVLDVLGKTVYYEKSIITQNEYFKEIELGKITTGIYIVQVKEGEKQLYKKLIIE